MKESPQSYTISATTENKVLSDGRMLDRRNLDARGAESNAVNLRSVDNRALKPAVCGDGRLKCPHCCRTYSSKKSYNAHCSRAHGIILRLSLLCPASGCGLPLQSLTAVIDHLKTTHGFFPDYIQWVFQTEDQYEAWKTRTEATHCVTFVQRTSYRCKEGWTKVKRLYCQHTGKPRPIKAISSKTTIKMGSTCPAFIVAYYNRDGTIGIRAQLRHYGHSTSNFEMIPVISDSTNEEVVRLLMTVPREAVSEASLVKSKDVKGENFYPSNSIISTTPNQMIVMAASRNSVDHDSNLSIVETSKNALMNWICKLDESFGTLKVEANNFGDVDRINREQWNSLLTAMSESYRFSLKATAILRDIMSSNVGDSCSAITREDGVDQIKWLSQTETNSTLNHSYLTTIESNYTPENQMPIEEMKCKK